MLARLLDRAKLWARWWLFPGFDLHTRCRYRFLPRFFRSGEIFTLDAGSGNGALSYGAFERGNRVLGITHDPEEVRKAGAFFSWLGVESDRLTFEVCNLYDVKKLSRKFDQIICSETLEHISRDREVVQSFFDMLNDGGVLHLCSPYALHPDHRLGRTNAPEDGGHVRDGYTAETYRTLLEPVGFEIREIVGLGAPVLVTLDSVIRYIRNRWGDLAAAPLFLATWPLQFFDSLNPAVPYSLYVQAVKRAHSE